MPSCSSSAPQIDALTLANALHPHALCRVAVRLAPSRCPSPLPSSTGGALQTYSEESRLVIALLRTLWLLNRRDVPISSALLNAFELIRGRVAEFGKLSPRRDLLAWRAFPCKPRGREINSGTLG